MDTGNQPMNGPEAVASSVHVCVGETMRAALNTLATVAPQWLLKNSQPEWVERYGKWVEASRLPESKEKQEVYVNQVGLDGQLLLQAIYGVKYSEMVKPNSSY